MDGVWQQQNGNVHDELDLTIPSDDIDSFWNNLATVDDDNDYDNDDDDEDYTGAASSSRNKRRASKHAKRHHREQIEQLEVAFQECSHPDENMRLDLAKKLGMGALQVKFWYQNRRSAKKNQLEKQENKMLREENEALKAEHQAIKAALLKKICPTCGGPMVPREGSPEIQRLLLDNARLKDEIFHKTKLLKHVTEKAPMTMPGGYGQLAADLDINGPDNSLVMDSAVPPPPHHTLMDTMVQGCVRGSCTRANAQRTEILGRVLRARDEFMMMVKKDTTMWLPTLDGEALDYRKYYDATFATGILGHCPEGFAMNGTRDTDMVMGTGADIISILTDVTRLCEAFPGIVGSVTAKNIAPPTDRHGLVQLMNVNLMVQSPRMPSFKVLFVRRSHKIEPNVWAVVDVSVNDICGQDSTSCANTWINGAESMVCRLRPSGCLIEDMNNGYCKVTWVVNAEYDRTAVPGLYHPLIRSAHAFGARRWLTSLKRRCQYLALQRSDSVTYIGKTQSPIPPEGRNRVLELSQQMTVRFCAALCGAGPRGQAWGSVDERRRTSGVGAESFEVAVRVATLHTAGNAQGVQAGLVVSAATTVWLPGTPAKHVFDYICDSHRRGEWDTFSNGKPVEQEEYVAAVQFPSYAVSVLHPMAAHGTNNKKLILQQVCADDSCMLVAYAPAEELSLKEVMRGGSPAVFSLLPSGFVILPDGHGDDQIRPVDSKRPSGSAISHRNNDGCLVSALFQTFLRGPSPENLTPQTIDNVENLLSRSIVKIKDAVHASVVVTA